MPGRPNLTELPELLGNVIGRAIRWNPVGKVGYVAIDDSDDRTLVGANLEGTVQAFDAGMYLLFLSSPISYRGHYAAPTIRVVVTVPAVRGHSGYRSLLTWSAVRIVDAKSFAMQTFGSTIATGRLKVTAAR